MDSWVEGDHLISLDGLLGVPLLDHLQDPFAERLADKRIGYIADPLLRKFPQLLLDGQVQLESMIGAEMIQDGLDLEALVLWHRQVFEVVR